MRRKASGRFSTSASRSGCAAAADSTTGRLAWSLVLALAFDTSTPMVSVAIVQDSTTLADRAVHAPNGQGETLAPLIDEALREAGVELPQVDVVGVGLGPGPFTGLRVGVVTAAGLADALGIPAHGMCSLDAIATSHPSPEPILVITDARRKQVYWATYTGAGVRVLGPELGPPADVASEVSGQLRVVVGAATELYADAFDGFDVRTSSSWPSAEAIARHALAEASRGAAQAPLEPLYLRRPDARPPGAPKRVTPA